MSILSIIIVILVLALVLWLINRVLPIDNTFKTILNVLVVILVIIWLLRAGGLLSGSL